MVGDPMRNNWTFERLLKEKVPDLNKYESTTTNRDGTVPTYPRECGRTFQVWNTFDEEVEEFYRTNTKILDLLPLGLGDVEFTFNRKACGNEDEIHDRILNNFALPLESLLRALEIPSLFKRPAGDNQVLFNPDIVWKIGAELNSNLSLVIEVKPWWSFDCIDNIVDQYHEDTDKTTKDTKVVKALQQIYGYMSYNYMRYGILTTYKSTYFLRRNGDSTLYISKPITLDSGNITILQYWLFVLCKSHKEGFYSSPAGNPVDPTFYTSKGKPFQQELKPIVFRDGLYKKKKYNLVDIQSSQIKFADLTERKHGALSRGCCGAVISGSIFSNVDIKFKTIDSFNNADAMEICLKEIAVYDMLESLQGSIIPSFYGFFNLHGILILALEDCGLPLAVSDISLFQNDVNSAIKTINKLGLKHSDLESRQLNGQEVYPNILVKENKIRIIDFHISEVTDDAVDDMEWLPKEKKLRRK
jgi:hypothetical protein